MPQIDVTVFFFEMGWFFFFFLLFVSLLIQLFLIPTGEIFFVRRHTSAFLNGQNIIFISSVLIPTVNMTYRLAQINLDMQKVLQKGLQNNFLLNKPVLFTGSLFFVLFISEQTVLSYHVFTFLNLLLLLIGVLLTVAFFTLLERKLMASSQRRKGPNLVGFWGVLQPIADGLKLILKEVAVPFRANTILFVIASLLPFIISFSAWCILPLSNSPVTDYSSGLPLLLAFSSMGVYGVIFSGWASNSKYALLGGLRSAAQVISYELVLGFCYLCVALVNHSLNLTTIVFNQHIIWNIVPLFPVAVIFLIAMLAETNRTPFDLPEAEAELVAGYNVEYSSLFFAFFFLAEYSNMLLMASIFAICFLGGWQPIWFIPYVPGSVILVLKILLVAIFFVVVRAALPRVRYDQLMAFSWKVLLPLEFGLFFFYSGIVYTFGI